MRNSHPMACWNVPFDVDWEDVRQQLNEQLKCLDMRLETQVVLVAEIQDYFRRRAEVEMEYSRALEKLSKSLVIRHKAEKQKRDQWHLLSSYSCWQHLVSTTRRQSRDHAVLSEIYANQLINRFTQIMEDVQRMFKRCREIGIEEHDELLKVLHELHTAMKTYQTYYSEERQAEGKLHSIQAQRVKLEQSIAKEKLERSKKFRLICKETDKRQSKFNDAKIKALKARNDYLLCMNAANASVHKYFVDDLSDLIDCMDFGFHTCLARTLMMYVSSEECLKKSLQSNIDGMNKCITSLDSRVDKQKFLEFNNSAFMVPKKFEFQPHKGDEIIEVEADKAIHEELDQRHKHLTKRLTGLKTESEEIWKTLETAERSLLEMIMTKDYDCAVLFEEDASNRNGIRQPEALAMKLRADRQETEDFYLNKFREYTLGSNLIARLQSKQSLIRTALGEEDDTESVSSSCSPLSLQQQLLQQQQQQQQAQHASRPHSLLPPQLLHKTKKKRIGRTPLVGQPKLFAGSLEEYLELTNQDIPLIMKSCIRIINLYGLHHQGIFRVSGSQVEINNFRETFERGDDPLADVSDASDINSVAGVLKLYLRELREPLFPIYYFEQLMEVSQLESKQEFISKLKDVVANLPRTVFVVLRYLFAFLNHLSEFSDENMMDPYNLAICFGPTLLPIPEDKDQVQYQNLVNELIKNIIIYQEEIFPDDGTSIAYEKYISTNIPDENDVGESPPDQGSDLVDDCEADNPPSEDDAVFPDQDISLNVFGKAEILEAVAQFDFSARSDRELSFRRGDSLILFNQVSNDWWKGSFNGIHGLIPDKYILLKIRDEDKDKTSTDSGGDKRRTSSSSDSLSGVSASPRTASKNYISEECLGAQYIPPSSMPTSQLSSPQGLSDIRNRRRSLSPSSLNSLQPVSSPHWDARKLRPCVSADETLDEVRSLSDTSVKDLSAYDPADENSNQELAKHLDNTLQQVHTSISTLEKEKELERQKGVEDIPRVPINKDTPDLVMDLPVNPSSPTSGAGSLGESPPRDSIVEPSPLHLRTASQSSENNELTTAERFAMSNQCTMKKGMMSRSTSQGMSNSQLSCSTDAQTQTSNVHRSVSNPLDSSSEGKASSESPNGSQKIGDGMEVCNRAVNTDLTQISQLDDKGNGKTPLKTKPPVMKKPSNYMPSPDVQRKSQEREYKQTSC